MKTNNMTSGASATRRLTTRLQLEEGNEYRQILPTAEVIMKNESDKPSLDNNKAHKKAAARGRQCVRTGPPINRGHCENENDWWSLGNDKAHKKVAAE